MNRIYIGKDELSWPVYKYSDIDYDDDNYNPLFWDRVDEDSWAVDKYWDWSQEDLMIAHVAAVNAHFGREVGENAGYGVEDFKGQTIEDAD